jgi:hypothetical protein
MGESSESEIKRITDGTSGKIGKNEYTGYLN